MLHHAAAQIGIDHDMLSGIARQNFGVTSMTQLSEKQMLQMYANILNEQIPAAGPALNLKTTGQPTTVSLEDQLRRSIDLSKKRYVKSSGPAEVPPPGLFGKITPAAPEAIESTPAPGSKVKTTVPEAPAPVEKSAQTRSSRNTIDPTPDNVRAASTDAGNRSMKKGGRAAWDEADYNAAAETYQRLKPTPLRSAKVEPPAPEPIEKPTPSATKSPNAMSAAEINKALDKLDKQGREVTKQFIDAGRGNERPSEWQTKSDPLSIQSKSIEDARMKLRNEVDRRYGPNAPSRLPKGFGPLTGQ